MAELTKLGRYELRRVLGRGAMGVVYEGLDPSLSRRVAVKTILKSVALDDETERAYAERFVKEAKAVARLNHPNIVQVYDFGVENEVAYLVMEFIQGRELRSFFEAKESFEPAESVRIMGELLDALEFAHEAGVIHRDIKPANVMLDAQRRVKLADFGVARVQDSDRSAAGTMVGTPAFMSPEQISGGKIDRRTDVFSAGTILYQLLTGEQPFKGDGAWTVARQIMQDDPARPSSIVTNLPLAFDEVVKKSLAKTPAQRFASAKEFAAALRGVLGGVQPAATDPGTVMPKRKAAPAQTSEAEVEFWRSIQNSNDVEEFSTYLEAFPDGTYSQLARVKMAKLKSAQGQDAQATLRLEAESKARHEEKERARREAEAKERREAEEQARRVALEKAKREVDEKAKRDALEKARRDAEEKAKREAEERARRVAEEKARRDAEEKAKREAAEKVKREAAEKAKREAEEKIRQAQALARLKQQEEAAARARAATDEDATVSIGSARPAAQPPSLPSEQKKSYVLPAVAAAAVVIAVSIGAYLFLGRTPAPAPVAQPAPPQKAEISAADIERIRTQTEARIRREYADKSAAEQAAAAKAAAEKAVQEKQLALKAAADKAATEKAAADKAATEKAAAEKTLTAKAAERAAAERAAAEKIAAEKSAVEKAAAEKVAAETAAAEKAAAEKAAAEKAAAARAVAAKPGWPAQGDRWVYEAREANNPDKKYQVGVEIVSVSSNGIHDSFRSQAGSSSTWHYAGAALVGEAPGVISFVPYLRAFQEVRGSERWNEFPIRVRGCAPQGGWTCIAGARVVGRERVSVRAGSFEAWKIVVEIGMRGSSGFGYSSDITYWYAEEAKRYVKYQSRMRNPFHPAPSMDMELLSYTPAGAK